MTPDHLLALASSAFLVQAIWLSVDSVTRIRPAVAFLNFAALSVAALALVSMGSDYSAGVTALQGIIWLHLTIWPRPGTETELELELRKTKRQVYELIRVNAQLAQRVYERELADKRPGVIL